MAAREIQDCPCLETLSLLSDCKTLLEKARQVIDTLVKIQMPNVLNLTKSSVCQELKKLMKRLNTYHLDLKKT